MEKDAAVRMRGNSDRRERWGPPIFGFLTAVAAGLLIGLSVKQEGGLDPDQKPASANAVADGGLAAASDKKKDAWDKAQILSGFLASVVIAAVGILINSSIQRAQLIASDKNAAAQIAVAERNARAQLDQAERQAESQRRIQESTLTSQLVESLTSDNPLKRRIAIIALERSVPLDVYQRVIRVVVTSDPDEGVRRSASRAVGDDAIRSLSSNQTFILAAASPNRLRKFARTNLGPTTYCAVTGLHDPICDASGASSGEFPQPANEEIPNRNDSVFARVLLQGLNGAADFNRQGTTSIEDIAIYVLRTIPNVTLGRQHLVYEPPPIPPREIPSFGNGLSGTEALIITNSETAPISGHGAPTPLPSLPSVIRDGHDIAEWLMTHAADQVETLINASCSEVRRSLRSLSEKPSAANGFKLLHFAGHSYIDDRGAAWVCADGDVLYGAELLATLSLGSAPVVVFADTSFGIGLNAAR